MKPQHIWTTAIALISVVAYLESFYEHPTFGNGLRAFIAAATLGKLA